MGTPRTRRFRWLPELVALSLVVFAVGAAAVRADRDDNPARRVLAATADLATWPAARYQGVLVDPGEVTTTVDLVVTADGIAHGTLTRDFGARAELAVDGATALLKGNREWWRWERPADAETLADRWVDSPPGAATGLVPVARLTPTALAGQFTAASPAGWTETAEERAGQPSRLIDDGNRQLAVTADAPHRVLAVHGAFPAAAAPAPGSCATHEWRERFSVTRPDADQAARTRDTVRGIRAEAAGAPSALRPPAPSYGPEMLEVRNALGPDQNRAREIVDSAVRDRYFPALYDLFRGGNLANDSDLRERLDTAGSGCARHALRSLAEAAFQARAGAEPTTDQQPPRAEPAKPVQRRPQVRYETPEEIKVVRPEGWRTVVKEIRTGVQRLNIEHRTVVHRHSDRHLTVYLDSGLSSLTRQDVLRRFQDLDVRRLVYDGDRKKLEKIAIRRVGADGRIERYLIDPDEIPVRATKPGAQAVPALFSPPGTGKLTGPLADQLKPGAPGGIDLTSLELRYLADTGSPDNPGMQSAFTARPAASDGARGFGPHAAVQASDSFFVWLSLPRSAFWVNLNPDQPDRITDAQLGRTEVGRIMLEADLLLKQNVSWLKHPDTPTGEQFWRALDERGLSRYCFQSRVWIVAGPAKINAEKDAVQILEAPLKVQLEKSHYRAKMPTCAGNPTPPEDAERQHEELQQTLLLPHLERAVNEAPEYADLRRIHLSRVAAEWYRQRSSERATQFSGLIDRGDVEPWASDDSWSPRDVFERLQDSYFNGDYTAPRHTPRGVTNITMGGINLDKVPLVTVTGDELRNRWAGLTDTVDDSFDQPTRDAAHQLWLGSTTTQAGFAMPPPVFLWLAAGLLALLWVRYRWRRRRRRRQRRRDQLAGAGAAIGPPSNQSATPVNQPSADAVAARLEQLRRAGHE